MIADPNILENCTRLFNARGKDALERARTEMLTAAFDRGILSSALKYFAKVTLRNALPVFPALMSLSCSAVGGKSEKTAGAGAALMLYAGAADIHDDIIDKSDYKYSKKTVYGKFGSGVALLAGDALLIQGANLLHKECETLIEEERQRIINATTEAFFQISKAETKEISLRGKLDVAPSEYFRTIELKASVPKVHCEIGAVLGNGDEDENHKLADYGRTFGILSLIVEEFADLLDTKEFESRMRNECPPLPFLYALGNQTVENEVQQLFPRHELSRNSLRKAAIIALGSSEVKKLSKRMEQRAFMQINKLSFVKNKKVKEELAALLLAQVFLLKHSLQ